MPDEIEQIVAAKVRRMVDTVVTVDVPSYVNQYWKDQSPEAQSKRIREWVSEQREFLRGHRSRDGFDVTIEDVFEDQCSACESPWETMDEGAACAHCGALVESEKEKRDG